jgi:hypothetical protein
MGHDESINKRFSEILIDKKKDNAIKQAKKQQ